MSCSIKSNWKNLPENRHRPLHFPDLRRCRHRADALWLASVVAAHPAAIAKNDGHLLVNLRLKSDLNYS